MNIVTKTASVLANFNLFRKNMIMGLAIKEITAAIAKNINTDCILYKKYSNRDPPKSIPIALKIPLAMIFEFISVNIRNY